MVQYVLITLWLRMVLGGHYKGGTITWRPVDEYSTANLVQILIQEKHTWTYPRFDCNPEIIASQGPYFDANDNSTYPKIECLGTCAATGGFQTINHITYCTDYNVNTQISTGAYYTKQWLSRSANLNIGYASRFVNIEYLINLNFLFEVMHGLIQYLLLVEVHQHMVKHIGRL